MNYCSNKQSVRPVRYKRVFDELLQFKFHRLDDHIQLTIFIRQYITIIFLHLVELLITKKGLFKYICVVTDAITEKEI